MNVKYKKSLLAQITNSHLNCTATKDYNIPIPPLETLQYIFQMAVNGNEMAAIQIFE